MATSEILRKLNHLSYQRNLRSCTFYKCLYCIKQVVSKPPNDPCNPSPCGPGAICRSRGTSASCECEANLRGDPYTGCRPECIADSDCSPSRACIRSHCRDPCQGTCGIGAECETINHVPLCSCPLGTRGNAFERCDVVTVSRTHQGMQREPSIKTLCSPLYAEFWKHSMLSSRTRRICGVGLADRLRNEEIQRLAGTSENEEDRAHLVWARRTNE